LVGEEKNGFRFLVDRRPLDISSYKDIETAFKRCQYQPEGTTGYALEGADITAEVNPAACIEARELKTFIKSDWMILYRVVRVAEVSPSPPRMRELVDICLAEGQSVNSVSPTCRGLAGVIFGHSVIERLWRETLILRDLAFLADTREARREKRLFLLHDLCPLNHNVSDSRKLGHLTVAYKEGGKKKHHVIAVYLELTSAGTAQDGRLKAALAYFQMLARTVGDLDSLDEFMFAATFTDRGATLGASDDFDFRRLVEPVHRLHLTIQNLLQGYSAVELARVVCKAASFAATAPEFQESRIIQNK
jgi:hypothetical protein